MYSTRRELMRKYQISESTVDRVVKIIREEDGKRYPSRCDAIINFGNRIRIRNTVFHDALRYRDLIVRGIAPRYEGEANYEGEKVRKH